MDFEVEIQGLFNSTTFTASGGTPSYHYAVTQGPLPPSLTLGPNSGVLSGPLSTANTYNFTVTVTDAHDCRDSQVCDMIISPPKPRIDLINKAVPPFKLIVKGSNLQNGIKVTIDEVLWPSVTWKSTEKIQITGGASLKAAVPKGVKTHFKFENTDGGFAELDWQWP